MRLYPVSGQGTVEEERRGQSTRFRGPGMDGKLRAALEASWMDGKLVSAMGLELGAGLEASGMDGRLGLAMGKKLGAGLEASGMDGTLGLAVGTKLGAGPEVSWMELVFESWRSLG